MKPTFFIALVVIVSQLSFTTIESSSTGKKILAITSPNAWMVLGSRTVNYGTDYDVITNASQDTWFSSIYIKVTDAPIKINYMKVYFDNGDKFDVSIRSIIKQNGNSRTIELPGGQRKINRVEFSYETPGSNHGHATLTLWGKY